MSKEEKIKQPSLPPDQFAEWWLPTGTDKESGASVGGHPDARRCWARKEPGRWVHKVMGIKSDAAWWYREYREEYRDWVDAGKPERKPFVSIAWPMSSQTQKLRLLRATLSQIGKPVINLTPQERQDEAARMGKKRHLIEPTDEVGESNEPF